MIRGSIDQFNAEISACISRFNHLTRRVNLYWHVLTCTSWTLVLVSLFTPWSNFTHTSGNFSISPALISFQQVYSIFQPSFCKDDVYLVVILESLALCFAGGCLALLCLRRFTSIQAVWFMGWVPALIGISAAFVMICASLAVWTAGQGCSKRILNDANELVGEYGLQGEVVLSVGEGWIIAIVASVVLLINVGIMVRYRACMDTVFGIEADQHELLADAAINLKSFGFISETQFEKMMDVLNDPGSRKAQLLVFAFKQNKSLLVNYKLAKLLCNCLEENSGLKGKPADRGAIEIKLEEFDFDSKLEKERDSLENELAFWANHGLLDVKSYQRLRMLLYRIYHPVFKFFLKINQMHAMSPHSDRIQHLLSVLEYDFAIIQWKKSGWIKENEVSKLMANFPYETFISSRILLQNEYDIFNEVMKNTVQCVQ